MAFTQAWVETDPDGSGITVSQLDDAIRVAKIATRERLEGDPANPVSGVVDVGTFATTCLPKPGAGRFHYDSDANKGTYTLQDGRGYFTADGSASHPRVYSLATTGLREIAYTNLDGSRAMTILNVTGDVDFGGALAKRANNNIVLGNGGQITTSTNGWPWIPSVAGAPTGVPSPTFSNWVPITYDRTNNQIYIYNGAWKKTVALT